MATRGRPPKSTKATLKCLNCGKDYVETNFYSSDSKIYSGIGKILFCKNCIKDFYNFYYEKYKNENYAFPEKRAIKRLCMILDLYYGEDAFEAALNIMKKNPTTSVFAAYMRAVHLDQHSKKSYDDTFNHDEQDGVTESYINLSNDENANIDESVVKFFGNGFSKDDYDFLKWQYDDWVARHECQTKTQEEIFKQICFTQLELLKKQRLGEDTKDLTATFQKLLETANLQPKQNSKDAMSDAQTFGTLIDKWENTRPIPEVEEELKDVDKIGYLIHVFFTGHMAKVLNIPSSISNLYDKFIKKYTVEKHIDSGESNNEALFDKIFGKRDIDEPDI